MKLKVISGGQTGVDQSAWRIAKSLGIPTGGLMPLGFLTEDGCRPEFARLYGAIEHVERSYPPRTRRNAADADVTLWVSAAGLSSEDSPGFRCTREAARLAGRPFLVGGLGTRDRKPWALCDDICVYGRFGDMESHPIVVNVAGPRESRHPGVGVAAEGYLASLFRLLLEAP